MKLLIIRHAEPNYAIDSLTEKGWREAALLAERLADAPIDAFYCSPLGRAAATARPTLEKLGRTAETLPWLREFAGTVKHPQKGVPRIPWDFAPSVWCEHSLLYDAQRWTEDPLMQSGNVAEIDEQTRTGVDTLLEKHGCRREGRHYRLAQTSEHEPVIALFCHMAIGMTVIGYLTGVSPFLLWHSFFLPTSSVSTLATQTDADGISHFRCVQLGDTSHLYAAGEPVSGMGMYPRFEL